MNLSVDHEAIHMYQSSVWGSYHGSCWSAEGYANAVGWAKTSKYEQSYVDMQRKGTIRDNLNKVWPNHKTFTQQQFADAIKQQVSNNDKCFSDITGYWLGAMFTEYLFKTYEFDKVQNFFINIITLGVDQSLRNNFGISSDTFYYNVSEYIIAESRS